jgi:hypothetical protein
MILSAYPHLPIRHGGAELEVTKSNLLVQITPRNAFGTNPLSALARASPIQACAFAFPISPARKTEINLLNATAIISLKFLKTCKLYS